MIKIFFLLILFSNSLFAVESLVGKNFICSKLLWGFEFISSNKVNVINTDINNITNINQYHYEINDDLPYINIYLMKKNVKNIVYSIHINTFRVDIWTMTSGGNTSREIIVHSSCKLIYCFNI